jgi:pyrimidine operon attenuation protein/uracil phosphoribosyltransferase
VTLPAQVVLDADATARTVRRMASEIMEQTRGTAKLGLVGILAGGPPIAARIAEEIKRAEQRDVPVGSLDITLYRDDAANVPPNADIGPSRIDFDVQGADVVLVDDVLHTGRTVRAAISSLLDYGRPRRIWLAVLCDRGGRELPIAADFVGRVFDVPAGSALDVLTDGSGVLLRQWRPSEAPGGRA